MWTMFKHQLSTFKAGIPNVLKYQIVTKLIFGIILMPVFTIAMKIFLSISGVSALSNQNILKYLLTPQGLLLGIVGLAMVLATFIIEICGFVTISAQILNNQRESSYLEILKYNLGMLPRMLEFGSVILLLYLVLFVPLASNGITLSIFENLKIPNFIMMVIEGNSLYATVYTLAVLIMICLSILWLFTFQFIVLGHMKPSHAMKASSDLVLSNKKQLVKHFLGMTVIGVMVVILVVVVWIILITSLIVTLDLDTAFNRILLSALLVIQQMGIVLLTMLFIPYEVHHLTLLYYDLTAKHSKYADLSIIFPQLPVKAKMSLLDRILSFKKILIGLCLISVIVVAVPMGYFFDLMMSSDKTIEIMGHRAGGSAAPENSIAGIIYAIENGASWAEVDVQRTKDGHYILNHDTDFMRVAGDPRKAQEMTLAEIKRLKLHSNNGEQVTVPTIDEVLETCKGRIGINLELKGSSADQQMVEDMVQKINQEQMASQVILTSLDYKLIEYIEAKYPAFNTGFIYFLSFGNIGSFKADYLIVEEEIATENNIDRIHEQGKKAVVWTVNSEESMAKFSETEVDAIITDEVSSLADLLTEKKHKNRAENFLDFFVKKF